jgi:TP901 family phage tail tape measure protein
MGSSVKGSNVDLTTLSTGFAVLGDAAEAANIDTDQLNAVIATIAETSISSGKEVANTAKAIIAGFQSDSAQKALQSLGIAITDSEGKARSFLDISRQIAQLKVEGVISDKQFSELTLAIGGGTRRQAPVATFIENLAKIPEIQKASQEANAQTGESLDAFINTTDTVATAITRLGNAFQSLAQSTGESGGILDLSKLLINALTAITEGLASVAESAGKAGPALAATLAAVMLLRTQGAQFNLMGGLRD